jgi:pyruvate kinase
MAVGTNAEKLLDQLELIVHTAKELEGRFAAELELVHSDYFSSARNLVHYLALRHIDIRELQEQLARLGLSSLGRAERNVMASVCAVQKALRRIMTGQSYDLDEERRNFEQSDQTQKAHIADILGAVPNDRDVRIMVTLPAEAADEYPLVYDLVNSGMNIARINCAHDSDDVWLRMIENIRRVYKETGLGCGIVMDIAGTKLRTGNLRPGPGVVRIHPRHDSLGRVIAPRHVRFVAEGTQWISKKSAIIPVPQECIDKADVGDVFHFIDTRGKGRKIAVERKNEKGLHCKCHKTAFIGTGTRLELLRSGPGENDSFKVGRLPSIEEPLLLKKGDTLILHRDGTPGEREIIDAEGTVVRPAHIACRQPEAFRFISAGDPIHLNDGKIEGTVESVSQEQLRIRITQAKKSGSRLRGNKGINFPKSDIQLGALTEIDKTNLQFVAGHADAVCLSFVREPADIVALQEELKKYPAHHPGIITKIETVKGFNDLPRLLLTTMRHYPAAVMIARGDLAVEAGWERLAEIQEEILWMCEAARLPVIWATAVLDRETRNGRPSRAEITDAAMSQRADCVMLNKGPYILAAIEMLANILRRMQEHQYKKTPKLRRLSISDM